MRFKIKGLHSKVSQSGLLLELTLIKSPIIFASSLEYIEGIGSYIPK